MVRATARKQDWNDGRTGTSSTVLLPGADAGSASPAPSPLGCHAQPGGRAAGLCTLLIPGAVKGQSAAGVLLPTDTPMSLH